MLVCYDGAASVVITQQLPIFVLLSITGGDDAYFVNGDDSGALDLGVFDGVGGWASLGHDPGVFSRGFAKAAAGKLLNNLDLGSDMDVWLYIINRICPVCRIVGTCSLWYPRHRYSTLGCSGSFVACDYAGPDLELVEVDQKVFESIRS